MLRARKRFGQHFLHDRAVLEHIIATFNPSPEQTIIEIGPGRGALTGLLLAQTGCLHAIEIDRDLAAQLQQTFASQAGLTVHQQDVLKFDWSSLPDSSQLRIIGNLPYNISTPLLFHLLDRIERIQDMLFMLQKEVADRLSASPGGKDYGRLSVMVQWRCEVESLFDVGPDAFTPPPKVESSVVRLRPRVPSFAVGDVAHYARVVQAAFLHRRKTLRNSLKGLVNEETFRSAGIDPQRRAETLSFQEFAKLAQTI